MININVLSTTFDPLLTIDDYYSMVIAERYDEVGDFILELPIHYENNPYIVPGNIILVGDSKKALFIEDINPIFDDESGSRLVIEGPSAESMLGWRVRDYDLFLIDYPIKDAVLSLISENITSPSNPNRQIPSFTAQVPTDPAVTTPTITNQYAKGDILSLVQQLCFSANFGFSVELDGDYWVFKLYAGVDRSYNQTENAYVVFSQDFDNVISSSLVQTTSEYKSVSVVRTEELDPVPESVDVYEGDEPSGLERRETLVDAVDIRRDSPDPEDPPLSDLELLAVIFQRGLDALVPRNRSGLFDGEFDTSGSFKYGVDFFMGDIVQCVLNGRETEARITEHVTSITESGTTTYVSFSFNI